jgi:hypothetical protein
MENEAEKRTLLEEYHVAGFQTRAQVEAYDDVSPATFVVTLDRRSKKRCAAVAEKRTGVFMIVAGDARAISVAASEQCISISRCVALTARRVAA